jgi:adenylosuccinate synthase
MITIVVGGQYGGEGKGKVCAYLGLTDKHEIVCRTGGVNSSHTVVTGEMDYRLRMIPASAVMHRSQLVFGAGSLLHIPTLFAEAEALGIAATDIKIDPQAGVVTEDCIVEQRADSRYQNIGSTLTGTGYASAARCQRRLRLAKSFRELKPYLCDVAQLLYSARQKHSKILVEGHQGSSLSNYHGDYPFTSSRDCIAAALMSELGLAPNVQTEVVLVLKLFPTRNHGGHLPREMTQQEATALGIEEYGGGSWGITDNRRRVGKLELTTAKRAILLNGPAYIALTGFDYLFPNLKGASAISDLTQESAKYLDFLSKRLGVPVGLVSTGPETTSVIDLRGVHLHQVSPVELVDQGEDFETLLGMLA